MNKPLRALLFLAACALAGSAHASYGQMRLDGINLLLSFWLTLFYVMCVDVGLWSQICRHRWVAIPLSAGGVVVAALYLLTAASAVERDGFFKFASGGSGPLVLILFGVVLLPFIVIAPLAQYQSMREDKRWPGWIGMWFAVQAGLLPGLVVLAFTDQHFWQREYDEAYALGSQVKAGEFGALLERADRQKDRIWGTGWSYPWHNDWTTGSTGWPLGLALGVDASAPIASNDPPSDADRVALQRLTEKYLMRFAAPRTRAKQLWDVLEPGNFAALLAPQGVDEGVTVAQEVIPVLLERLEKYGTARLCPGGRLMDADRVLLNALIVKEGRRWNVDTRDYDMDPVWTGYQQRLERTCTGAATP